MVLIQHSKKLILKKEKGEHEKLKWCKAKNIENLVK